MTAPTATRGPVMLGVTAFTVGAGVMAIEITASRILAPYFGASIFVWTSIIVTVLLALSAGYWVGGSAAERGSGPRVLALLLAGAAGTLLTGVWAVGNLTRGISSFFLSGTDATMFLFVGSLLAAFLVFATPVFLLAAAGPVIVKSWAALGGDIGKVSGRYFAVSTLGSVVGTIAPTIVTVPIFGSKATVIGVSVLFLALAAILGIRDRRAALVAILVFPVGTALLPDMTYPPGTVEARESPYQFIRVENDVGRRKLLIFNEGMGVQSVYDPDAPRTGFYYDFFAALPHLGQDRQTKDALMLGLAGGTAMRQFIAGLPDVGGARITGVEVDPAVVDIAMRHFAIGELPIDVEIMDGRAFLAASDRTYDQILIDAYSTQLYIAPHLATKEFFELVRSRLRSGGIVAMNVNAADEESPLLRTLLNTISAVFDEVRYVPAHHWNYVVVASDLPIDVGGPELGLPQGYEDVGLAFLNARAYVHDPRAEVFTDDRAPIETLTDRMILASVLRAER